MMGLYYTWGLNLTSKSVHTSSEVQNNHPL